MLQTILEQRFSGTVNSLRITQEFHKYDQLHRPSDTCIFTYKYRIKSIQFPFDNYIRMGKFGKEIKHKNLTF